MLHLNIGGDEPGDLVGRRVHLGPRYGTHMTREGSIGIPRTTPHNPAEGRWYVYRYHKEVITTLRCHRLPRVRLANPQARWQIRCHLRADAQPHFRNYPRYFFPTFLRDFAADVDGAGGGELLVAGANLPAIINQRAEFLRVDEDLAALVPGRQERSPAPGSHRT